MGRAFLDHADVAARRAGFGAIHLHTHERMTENLALHAGIGHVEYDRRRRGDARLVFLRKRARMLHGLEPPPRGISSASVAADGNVP